MVNKIKCKFCNSKEFKECGFIEMRRFQCENCKAYFIPSYSRFFGKYKGYPAWVSREDWVSRKYA